MKVHTRILQCQTLPPRLLLLVLAACICGVRVLMYIHTQPCLGHMPEISAVLNFVVLSHAASLHFEAIVLLDSQNRSRVWWLASRSKARKSRKVGARVPLTEPAVSCCGPSHRTWVWKHLPTWSGCRHGAMATYTRLKAECHTTGMLPQAAAT